MHKISLALLSFCVPVGLCAMLFSASSLAQSVQGQVLADRMGGTPLKGVTLFMNGAHRAVTGPDGRFVLSAAKSSAVQRLSVNLDNWVVVNDVLLERPIEHGVGKTPASKAPPLELNLIMTEPTRLAEQRSVYLSNQIHGVLHAPRPPRLGPGGDMVAAYMSAEERMSDAVLLDKVLGKWIVLADRGPADQMPPLYRDGLRAWWRHGSAKALALLSDQALNTQVLPLNGSHAGAAQAWMLRAMLHLATGDRAEAQRTMDKAVNKLPMAVDAWHFLAHVSQVNHGESLFALIKAVQLQEQLEQAQLGLSRHPTEITAGLHDALAEQLEVRRKPAAALQHWELAYKMYADLRLKHLSKFTDLASKASLNAARMQAALKQDKAALSILSETLRWRRELAQLEPTLLRQLEISTALLNQKQSQERLKLQCDAEISGDEALNILNELSDLDPLRFQAHRNRVMRSEVPQPKDCHGNRNGFFASISTKPLMPPSRQDLADTPAERWADSVQTWRNESNFAMMAYQATDAATAAQWTLAVLGIQLRQNEAKPGGYSVDLAKTLMRLGSLHQMSGKTHLALKSYQHALEYWTSVSQSAQPHPWAADIIATLTQRIEQLTTTDASPEKSIEVGQPKNRIETNKVLVSN